MEKLFIKKTFSLTTSSDSTTWKAINHNISNFDLLVGYSATVVSSVGGWQDSLGSGGGRNIMIDANATQLEIYVGGNNALYSQPAYVTIQYTKTTD